MMRKGKLFLGLGLVASLLLGGCKDKPTPSGNEAGAKDSSPLIAESKDREASRRGGTNRPQADTKEDPPATDTPADSEQPDRDILREYFQLIAKGERQSADKLAIRTQNDCLLFMEPETCEQTLQGQLEMQKTLDIDPIPRNSVLIDVGEGQEQSLAGKGGFLRDTTLWLGHTLRARGPGGKEFIMRSMGVLERQGKMRIIWGKRRAFKDTPRSPHLTPSAQPATEGK